MSPTLIRRARPITLLVMLAAAGACGESRQTLAGETYPSPVNRTEQLDIQVFRRGTNLEFTNTTARAFGPGRIWLNMWFSREIDGLAVGETVIVPIGEFRDEHGRTMRAGGFFATRAAEPIATAELQHGDEMLRLVFVRDPAR